MEPDNPLLDVYLLKQAENSNPQICFLPTASGDSEQYIARFYDFFNEQSCRPSHLSLFKPPTRDLESFILEKDILYVGGGNTKNLLAVWKEWELDSILRKAWHEGVILSGLSAGSICWFEQGVTDSYGDGLEPINCLGLLTGSHCPHYDGEIERRPAYHKLIESKKVQSGIAADDGVAIHYKGQEIHRIVSSRSNAKAYSVSMENGIIERELPTEYLGSF